MNQLSLRRLTAFVILSVSGLASAFAQEAQIDTQYQTNQQDQNTRNDPSPLSLNDSGLGELEIVSRRQRPKMFTLFTTQVFNFTTNAFLARDHEESDLFYNGRLGVSFIPYSTKDLVPRVTFEQNFFRFSDNDTLDFDAQTLTFELKYAVKGSETNFVNLSYALSRLESPTSRVGEFYKYGFLNVNFTHFMPLGSSPITLAVAGGSYWRAGDPSASDRVAVYGNAVAIYNPIDKVQLTGFARPEFQFYTHDPDNGDRRDVNLTVGATASWTPIEYISVAATASYVANFSSVGSHSYQVGLPGIVLAAQFSF